ncbi:MAG: DUF1574 domain-containing protein [Oscillospiraceae bacterium]|nr:DUF1574 domain-containing protein [Oscillospiraceae bacterium]
MKKIKFIIIPVVFLLVFFGLQRLLMPKYMDGVYDGAMPKEYYAEPKDHSVIFLGDCEVYENFSPIELWREYGISSYIRGGAQQLVWHSYYLLEDTLRYEKPDVVVLSIFAMQYGEPKNEAYNRLNLDGLRLSLSKINAARVSATSGESALSYVFPILRFHDRWQELNLTDLQYYFGTKKVGHNGYLMKNEVKPVDYIPDTSNKSGSSFSPLAWEYLDKTRELCEKNGITLVLIKAPTLWPAWYPEFETQMEDYAEKYGLTYFNMLESVEEIGLDWNTDTYDAGQHMNLPGAEKCARWLGGRLLELTALPDLRDNAVAAAVWEKKIADYERMKEIQLAEIIAYGKSKTIIY